MKTCRAYLDGKNFANIRKADDWSILSEASKLTNADYANEQLSIGDSTITRKEAFCLWYLSNFGNNQSAYLASEANRLIRDFFIGLIKEPDQLNCLKQEGLYDLPEFSNGYFNHELINFVREYSYISQNLTKFIEKAQKQQDMGVKECILADKAVKFFPAFSYLSQNLNLLSHREGELEDFSTNLSNMYNYIGDSININLDFSPDLSVQERNFVEKIQLIKELENISNSMPYNMSICLENIERHIDIINSSSEEEIKENITSLSSEKLNLDKNFVEQLYDDYLAKISDLTPEELEIVIKDNNLKEIGLALRVNEKIQNIPEQNLTPELLDLKNKFKDIHFKVNLRDMKFDEYIDPERLSKAIENDQYANSLDENKSNLWNQIGIEGATNLDAVGIKLLSLYHYSKDLGNNVENIPENHKKLLQKFLTHSVGNMELNKFSGDFMSNAGIFDFNSSLVLSSVISDINYLSFKTRNIKELTDESLNKIASNLEKDPSEIPEEEQISLRELGIISDLSKLSNKLDFYGELGLIDGNAELENLYYKVNLSKKIMAKVSEERNNHFSYEVSPRTCTVIFNNATKYRILFDKALTFFQRIKKFICNYDHTSLLKVKGKEINQSHIFPEFVEDQFKIEQQIFTDMYQIDPIALIPKGKHKMLEAHYGEDWQDKIRGLMSVIEDDIQTRTDYESWNANANRGDIQEVAGIADLALWGHRKDYSHLKPWLWTEEQTDFKDLHKKVMDGTLFDKEQENYMMCSQFVATNIVAFIVELDKQIKEDLNGADKGKEDKGEKKVKDNETIVRVPFPDNEDLHKMHPARLLKCLNRFNCARRVYSPLDKYIKEPKAKSVFSSLKKYVSKGLNVAEAGEKIVKAQSKSNNSELSHRKNNDLNR